MVKKQLVITIETEGTLQYPIMISIGANENKDEPTQAIGFELPIESDETEGDK